MIMPKNGHWLTTGPIIAWVLLRKIQAHRQKRATKAN